MDRRPVPPPFSPVTPAPLIPVQVVPAPPLVALPVAEIRSPAASPAVIPALVRPVVVAAPAMPRLPAFSPLAWCGVIGAGIVGLLLLGALLEESNSPTPVGNDDSGYTQSQSDFGGSFEDRMAAGAAGLGGSYDSTTGTLSRPD